MSRSRRDLVWIPIFAVLVAFAVPWPLWGVDRVVAGLPVWIWWHIAWLCLCTVLFSRFVRNGAWERGMGIRRDAASAGSDTASARGDRP
ncbi:DUF3311 domain-containing protein [Halorubrum sp. DTA46]|uniref:DUF3311 domain-containing protein n=1 Tax=Halorubrum sp. DTA46 TaxID=3402162 RepID=UPI003AAAD5E0